MVCTHHWDCEIPAGPVSKARCKLCGEEQELQNHLGRDEAEQLPYERGPAYLPPVRQVSRMEVTQEPDQGPLRPDNRCHHYWKAEDPNEKGISHLHCTRCPLEFWIDPKGRHYDSQGNLLRNQNILPGEYTSHTEKKQTREEREVAEQNETPEPRGRYATRTEEYNRRWPEILQKLEELGNIPGLARYLGINYATCQGLLQRRGVDVKKYQIGRGRHRGLRPEPVPVEKPAAPATRSQPPLTEIVAEIARLRETIGLLQEEVHRLQAERQPQCQLVWENGEPIFVCETQADASRMELLLSRKIILRVKENQT